jgi:hypothetical protein
MAAGYAIGFSGLGSFKQQGSLLRSVLPNRRKSSWKKVKQSHGYNEGPSAG